MKAWFWGIGWDNTMSTFEYKVIAGVAKLYQFSKPNDDEFELKTYSDWCSQMTLMKQLFLVNQNHTVQLV